MVGERGGDRPECQGLDLTSLLGTALVVLTRRPPEEPGGQGGDAGTAAILMPRRGSARIGCDQGRASGFNPRAVPASRASSGRPAESRIVSPSADRLVPAVCARAVRRSCAQVAVDPLPSSRPRRAAPEAVRPSSRSAVPSTKIAASHRWRMPPDRDRRARSPGKLPVPRQMQPEFPCPPRTDTPGRSPCPGMRRHLEA